MWNLNSEKADQIKNITTYKKYESIYTSYQNSTDKDAYLRMHESMIILFEAAKVSLGAAYSKQPLSCITMLKNLIQELTVESKKLMIDLKQHKEKVAEMNRLKNNLEIYI